MNPSPPSDRNAILEMVLKKLQELDDEIEFNSNAWQETILDVRRLLKLHGS